MPHSGGLEHAKSAAVVSSGLNSKPPRTHTICFAHSIGSCMGTNVADNLCDQASSGVCSVIGSKWSLVVGLGNREVLDDARDLALGFPPRDGWLSWLWAHLHMNSHHDTDSKRRNLEPVLHANNDAHSFESYTKGDKVVEERGYSSAAVLGNGRLGIMCTEARVQVEWNQSPDTFSPQRHVSAMHLSAILIV